jgi:hypothetical protein
MNFIYILLLFRVESSRLIGLLVCLQYSTVRRLTFLIAPPRGTQVRVQGLEPTTMYHLSLGRKSAHSKYICISMCIVQLLRCTLNNPNFSTIKLHGIGLVPCE